MAETPITFRNHDQQLVGMIHTPDRDKPSPAVLMLHGFTGNRMESHFLFVKMARRLAAAGYTAMRFDFRGSGESQGNFWEMTVPGEIDDARAALAWLRQHPAVDPERVILLGLSMGGAVAASVAGEDSDIVGLILWSAVADFGDVSRSVQPLPDDAPPLLGPLPDGRFDLGGLLLGTVLLPVPVLGQKAEPDLDAINDEIRDRQSRRLGLEEEAETIQNQSKRLRLRVIELARDIRNIDIERERIEERLSELAVTESQLDAQVSSTSSSWFQFSISSGGLTSQ